MENTPLYYLSIEEAGRRMRQGRLSSVKLVEACLERISELNGVLHAFITVAGEKALDKAFHADAEISRGRYLGPLHGIPLAHKDNIETSGTLTTAHSNLLRSWVPSGDAVVHRQLENAGAIILGKLALWEFAAGTPTASSAFPAARNPWNMEYSPSGSSSGSGAAVAAGLCLGATGTDTGGSIRSPSAACGIVGMKPTFDLVSTQGTLPLAPSLDHVGPMTRNVRDNAIMLQAMAAPGMNGPDFRSEDIGSLIGAGVSGMRIGIPRRALDRMPYDPACLSAFEDALDVLRSLGVCIVEFDFPELEKSTEIGAMQLYHEAFLYHRVILQRHPELLDEPLRAVLKRNESRSAAELAEIEKVRSGLNAAYRKLLEDEVDAVVTPAAMGIPVPMENLMSPAYRHVIDDPTRIMFNLTGLPALAMPMGFGAKQLPLGIQFAAGWKKECRVYQLASAYEAATPWSSLRPLGGR